MGVNFIRAFVLLVTISYISGQEYVLLDETDYDNWNANDQSPIFFDQSDHVIHRRDVVELEGSGNGDSEPAVPLPVEPLNNAETLKNEEPQAKDNPVEETPEKSKEIAGIQISNFGEPSPAVNEDASKSNETKTEPDQAVSVDNEAVQLPAEEVAEKVNKAEKAQEAEPKEPVEAEKVNEAEKAQEAEPKELVVTEEETKQVAKEIASPAEKPELVAIKSSNDPTTERTETSVTSKQAETTATSQQGSPSSGAKTDNPEEKGDSVNKETATNDPPKVLPSDLVEVETINNAKESEVLSEQQSGNAVLLKVPKSAKSGEATQVEGSESDKALQGMAENAKISNEPTEPATGESAKNVSRASKDTTILVVLFVVVIAIGGAAFTHNYIKKRKQNASANNDIVNGIRRSLQNLSSGNGKNNTDVEQGTEMKPLMKDGSPVVTKDYTDSKKEVPA